MKKITESQAEILKIIHELPPVNITFFFEATKDQICHFTNSKIYWKSIEAGLKGYFLGLSIEELIEDETSLKPTSLMMLDIYKWIKLYELMNFGWKFIESYYETTPYVMISTYNCPKGYCKPSSPGDALKFILEQTSYYYFAQCLLPNYNFSPQKFIKQYRNWQKLSAKKAINKPLTKAENILLKKITKGYDNSLREQYLEGGFLIEHFLEILSKSNDRLIKKTRKEYLIAAAESRAERIKCMHPRNKPIGHSWAKGKLLKGKKGGYA